MPKYSLVEEACRHCWNKNFMNEFQLFFDRHASAFLNPSSEHNLEFYDIYQKYLQVYEANLSEYIASLDSSVEEFYEQLMAVQEDPNIKDKKLKHFVNYLVASTDYNSFYKIMVRAAKRLDKADDKIDEEKVDDRSDAKASSSRIDDKGSK